MVMVLFICCEAVAHLVLCSRIDEAAAELLGPSVTAGSFHVAASVSHLSRLRTHSGAPAALSEASQGSKR